MHTPHKHANVPNVIPIIMKIDKSSLWGIRIISGLLGVGVGVGVGGVGVGGVGGVGTYTLYRALSSSQLSVGQSLRVKLNFRLFPPIATYETVTFMVSIKFFLTV